MLVRTTLRIKENLKKSAEKIAFTENRTMQDIFNTALSQYINKKAKKGAKKLLIKPFDLGVPLDNLTRDDFYPDPKF